MPTIPISLLQTALLDGANDRTVPHAIQPVGGGQISVAARVETGKGLYLAKWQPASVPQGAALFEAEAHALALLRRADSGLVIPLVMGLARSEEGAILLLEWLPVGQVTEQAAERLGEGLARLHRHLGESYGLDRDNFIGTTPQANGWAESWPDFFGEQRLAALAARLERVGRWHPQRARALARLLDRLPELLPPAPPPSLLHGDLWGGNWLPLAGERVALIDPATYFGDRESDLAMTRLFGGFPPRFYDAYRADWPLDPGFNERLPLYNLYHLMNHLLLFGEAYGQQVDEVLQRYAG